jgi:serine protease Do
MKILLTIIIAGCLGFMVALIVQSTGPDTDDVRPHSGTRTTAADAGGIATAYEETGSGRDGLPHASDPVRVSGELDASRRTAIVDAAEKVGPAVVSISVIKAMVVRSSPLARFRDPLFDQFFRDFFGDRQHVERIPSLGSGVIINPGGMVVTNEHVVRGATEIKVTLTDERQFDAQVVASDSEYDLALLRIGEENLPCARLGNSDSLLIGEWAIAIGNPFGYLLQDSRPTVTAGVISALHRNVTTSEGILGVYKDMIQTDAAINPGNSGGALVNSVGELIGVNTFIITQSGGSMGLGFAIPVNRVRYIVDEVAAYGRIRQIWIGLKVQEVTPLMASSLGLDSARGLIISEADPDSPAYKAGLRRGDVIIRVNREEATNFDVAKRAIFGSRVGAVLEFDVVRDGKEMTMRVVVEERPDD